MEKLNVIISQKNLHVLAVAVAVALLIPVVTEAASTVAFDNQSGRPALVKLAGSASTSISVENGKTESVYVPPGHYYIKIRYGMPGAYSYSKGDEFDVKETATTTSDITITLHKVVAGNYGSKSISEAEFGASERTDEQPKRTDEQPTVGKFNTETLKKLLPEFGRICNSTFPLNDDAVFNLYFSDKHTKLFNKLDTTGAAGLVDFVAEMDTWDVRYEHVDLIIENATPVATVRKVLGKEVTTEHTEMNIKQCPGSSSPTSERVDITWLGYGRWNFGARDAEVVIIRIYFPYAPTSPKQKTSPNESIKTVSSATNTSPTLNKEVLLGDPIVARGKDFEIKRSELDKVMTGLKSTAAAHGQAIPQARLVQFEGQLLNRLIQFQLLNQKATAADKAKGAQMASVQLTNLLEQAGSQEKLDLQMKTLGMTPGDLRSKITQETTAQVVLARELNVTATDADANIRIQQLAPAYLEKLTNEAGVEILDPELKQ